MVSYIEILEELINSNTTRFYDENYFAIDKAIEKLIKKLKDLKYIEQEHKEINGQLRERVKELEEENKQLEINQEILMKTNSTDCRVLESLNYGIRAYQKTNEQLKEKVKELEQKLEEKDMQHELELIGKEEYTKEAMGEIIEQYYTANEDCIPKSKIKEKIEERRERLIKGKKSYTNKVRINELNLISKKILEE